nr:C40 family peptidase [uncultured Anaerostipes sp.]
MIIKKMRLSMAVVTLAGTVLATTPVAAAGDNSASDNSKAQSESKYENKAVADVRSNTTLNIRKEGSLDSEIVGKMKKGNIATVVEKGSEWTKVKSGDVTGYVKNDYLVFDNDIEEYAKDNVKQVAKVNTETLRVREKATTDSDIIDLVGEGDTYTVNNQNDEWVKVSVDGETGYLSKDYTDLDYSFGKAKSMAEIRAEQKAKEEAAAAKAAAQAAANNTSSSASASSTAASSSSTTSRRRTSSSASSTASRPSYSSSSSTVSGSTSGARIASYARQFVGNPYRYGGTSLTNGADCSGFVMSVYAHFGYSLNRTSSAQASNGVAVSTSNLQPGDLLFYGSGGGINHVAIYIGGGQVVHASNSAPYPKGGIKISSAFYRTPVCARRIVR